MSVTGVEEENTAISVCKVKCLLQRNAKNLD